jgi:Holliday junction resolvasome RuvABC endonuclease subunit
MSKPQPFAVMAFDLATHTGWACAAGEYCEYGAIDLSVKIGDSEARHGAMFAQANILYSALLDKYQPQAVYLEEQGVGQAKSTNTARITFGLRAVLLQACYMRGILARGVSVGEWKRSFTGNGAAGKDLVLTIALGLGFKDATQDEADALGVLFHALPDYQSNLIDYKQKRVTT